LEGLGSSEGWRPSNDARSFSGSGVGEADVELLSLPPFVVGVLDSVGVCDSGSNSLIWSVSGDGAGLFEQPIDRPDSSTSAFSPTGGSFDSSSVKLRVEAW